VLQDQQRARRANRLLAALPGDSRERLGPFLEPVELRRGSVFQTPGAQIDHVYFLDDGLVSLVKTMADGRGIEVAAISSEGMVGWSAIGTGKAPVEAVVQLPGSARRLGVERVRDEMVRATAFRSLVLRYITVAAAQFAQTAACNSLHSVDQRCCRWLLIAHDSAGSESFVITHEVIALMLGVQRASVSIAAATLQRLGIVEYRHGRLSILDRRALEARGCECHGVIRAQIDDLLAS
jgi:CRP-like cAMP-binding protein